MKKPSFTVIVPIYGVEDYIRQCAETVLGQTYDDIQFIFVNDGTNDDSIVILNALIDEKFSHLRGRIRIVDKVNEGLPAARKTGVEYAEGDYILHIDADDWVEPDLVEKVAEKAVETGSDIICFRFFKEEKRRVKNRGDRKYTSDQKDVFLKDIMTHRAYGYVWNKCAKRELYVQNPVHFARCGMFEDVFLMTQLVYYADSYAHVELPLYHYRRTNLGSISRQKRAGKRLYSSMNMLDLYRIFSAELPSGPLKDTVGRIFFHAAWCSLAYGLDLFSKYPELAPMVRKLPVSTVNLVPLPMQLFVKFCVRLHLLR